MVCSRLPTACASLSLPAAAEGRRSATHCTLARCLLACASMDFEIVGEITSVETIASGGSESLRCPCTRIALYFGGSTIIWGLDGNYLSRLGLQMQYRVRLIYTNTPFAFEENFANLSRYKDALRDTAFGTLEEEAILVVMLKVYHAE